MVPVGAHCVRPEQEKKMTTHNVGAHAVRP